MTRKTRQSTGLLRIAALLLLAAAATGCVSHAVTFQDVKYATGAHRNPATVVAVIDKSTLENKVVIKSWMTGIANNWEAQPGDMLKQVADVELPQMFSNYAFANKDQPPSGTGPGIVLALSVANYSFANFHANVTVNAITRSRTGNLLFEKSYQAEGFTQGSKMFWGGAFGMKSAIRQSSLDAYKKIFAQMRTDLEKALADPQVATR